MKKNITLLYSVILLTFAGLVISSCEDYLDKAPASDITEEDVIHDFTSFQGFIEQCYNCIADPDKTSSPNNYSFADEILGCASPLAFDTGNWWGNNAYFFGESANISESRNPRRRIWESSWYGLRVVNTALDFLKDESKITLSNEEVKLIKGQALFFRGWFYFMICRYWGGMPYVTHKIAADEDMFSEEFNRLTAKESFLMMAKDFRAAADLLPNHWDQTAPGKLTEGDNDLRINKFCALGYLGESLLWAASPMLNEEATGKDEFDAELCKQSAEAFGELMKLCDETKQYYLESWDKYMEIFVLPTKKGSTGGKEVIMKPVPWNGATRWSTLGGTCPVTLNMNSGNHQYCPTHNIIQNFSMANGLPVDDPESGYDPNDPWTGREPRFYKLIVYDGTRISNYSNKQDQYAELFNGGRNRAGGSHGATGSATGYYMKKFNLLGPTFTTSLANNMQEFIPFLRMADVYLMYAEAVNWMTGGGPNAKASNYTMTALEAVNAVRNRAQIPGLTPKYYATKDAFFESIVRERAVELLMEAKRFDDLRRWNRIDDPRYLNKTAIDFKRGEDGKPVDVSERVVITRVASRPKMNWLPIQVKYTTQFEGFQQNPGW